MRKASAIGTRQYMAGALAGGLLLAAVACVLYPPKHRVGSALEWTARWSFIWFWLASSSRPLARIVGPRGPLPFLAARVREFGLGFAAAHLAHLALVAWVLAHSPFPLRTLLFFGSAALVVYLLALLSFGAVASRFDPARVRLVRVLGVEYISLAFLVDFLHDPLHDPGRALWYLPFLTLTIAGVLLRLIAFTLKRGDIMRLAFLACFAIGLAHGDAAADGRPFDASVAFGSRPSAGAVPCAGAQRSAPGPSMRRRSLARDACAQEACDGLSSRSTESSRCPSWRCRHRSRTRSRA